MKNMYELQQLLKQYGTIIYTTDRYTDLGLMEAELRELYSSQLVEREDYLMGMLLIKQEISKLNLEESPTK
jgi:uncharacterized protein YqgQ